MPENIVIQFSAHALDDAYRLQLRSLRDSIQAALLKNDSRKLHGMKLELMEGIAVIDDRLFAIKYPELVSRRMEREKELRPDKKDVQTFWTIDATGKKIDMDVVQ